MLPDKLKKWFITKRAWEIYVLLQNLSEAELGLLSDLREQIDLAVDSSTLILQSTWSLLNKRIAIRERYTFPKSQLKIESYSDALIESGDRVIIRADSAPHHERDYHRKLLARFPHHLHDENGRICSFSGDLEDFIKLTAPYLR